MMVHSLRDLFARDRQLRSSPIDQLGFRTISIRQSLSNHHDGDGLTLRNAAEKFKTPANGDGFSRGCRSGPIAIVVPSWVAADDIETRTIEGVLKESKITHEDFPLRPWHIYYDWNFHVHIDPQYIYLHSRGEWPPSDSTPSMECEWDTSGLPSWAWPQDGDRVWIRGRWIYDCGHPKDGRHKSEIHPPKAVASFRPGAHRLPGNENATRTIDAAVYFGSNGGYLQQSITDEDYVFDVPLPTRPNLEAQPAWAVEPQTGSLPVAPVVTPFPEHNPTQLRVHVALRDVADDLMEYGFLLHGGWTDPAGTASRPVGEVRITLDSILMDGDGDLLGDEWHVYVGVNGRWNVWTALGRSEAGLERTITLKLHEDDPIHISVCGFEEDMMHNLMGSHTGLTWSQIADPSMSPPEFVRIHGVIVDRMADSLGDKNDPIGRIDVTHLSGDRGSFVATSDSGVGDDPPLKYRLTYTISTP